MGRGAQGRKSGDTAVKPSGAGTKSGPLEFTIDGRVYDVTDFVKRHPGGSIIKFMLDQDASDAFHAFHDRSSKAQKYLKALPSRDTKAPNNDELLEDFAKLREDLRNEGFFDTSPMHVAYRASELLGLFAGGFYLVSNGWYYTGLVALALAQGRCGWFMHEAGHYSLTGKIWLDRIIQTITYNVGTGMSASYWRNQHNKHHAAPQKLEHDVDLNTLPLVAFHERIAAKAKGKLWLRFQALLFAGPITLLVALSWALIIHPRFLFRTKKFEELFAFAVRYAICGYIASITGPAAFFKSYLLCYWMAATYIFVLFAVSHTHKDVVSPDENVDWVHHALDYTTNCSPTPFVSWLMGYLNYQIEHHLFPSMPQFRHPEVSKRVQVLCKKHGIHYDTRPLLSCMKETFLNLHQVGNGTKAKKE